LSGSSSFGTAYPGSRFTYAIGRLVLWSSEPGFVDDKGKVLKAGRFSCLALANPETAAYGAAAIKTLKHLCFVALSQVQSALS
jgi:molybdate transport system substrate-binding protein